ncbi:hypothetical protein [Nocardia fluminea]|uniref:hypothetical protein n=1 Tax=Nocardia fluminea TaxID=134984 RepID=UPI00364CB34F
MTTVLALALYVLTAARLTRIITTDRVGLPLRKWALDKWGADSMLSFLAHCPWCVGWYVALALAFPAAVVAGLPWWWGFGLWPAGSYLVGVLARYDVE